MTIAIVILNWNGKKLLAQFLPSVVQYSKEATVYLADNASSDDSVTYVSENFPKVKIIQNKTNGGYAKGYNDALKSVSEDIYVLLNSDVEVTENWLEPILSEFENDSQLQAAQPKILDFKNKAFFEYAGAAGGFIDALGYPYCRGRIFNTLEKDEGQYDDITTIFWATGASLFIRNSSFWEIGGLDEDFFAHQEEIDLCWRLQNRGGVIKYIGASSVYHVGGATLASGNPKKTFYNFRNTLFALLKNVKGGKILGIIIARLLLDGIAAFQFLFQGKPLHFIAIFKSHLIFYKSIPKLLKKRRLHSKTNQYYRINSIVWRYFIQKKRYFREGY